ncbi:glycine zipper family protein [Bartonella birtlesii]|nr:glycine zipper family protein [Bartonella birtlesii]
MSEYKDYDKSLLPEWARKYKVVGPEIPNPQNIADYSEYKDYDKSLLPEWAREYKVVGPEISSTQDTTDDFSFSDEDLSVWDAIMSHGISGLTAGYSDEIQAANEAGFTDYWSGDKRAEEIYNRRVAKERAYQKALEEKHPVWSSIGYILGSIVPTAASFIPGLGLLRAGSVATSTFGNLGKAALLGAGSGALHGSGAGDGLSGRLISAGTGGVIGGVAGPVGSLAGTAASWGTKK